MNDDQKKKLDSAVLELQKKFGEEYAFVLGGPQHSIKKVARWPIDSPKIADILGGGLPKGRIIEIYGPESAGKTSLACYFIGQVQKAGGVCAFVDTEHALDPPYAATFGMKLEELIFSQPDSGEQALNIVDDLVESDSVDLIVVDSVAALTPQAELDGAMDDMQVGLLARLMSKACRKLTHKTAHKQCTIIFLNQIRDKIGGYGNPEDTTGGKALKFYSSIRIEIRRVELINGADEIAIGLTSRVKAVKNKTAVPMKKQEVKILYGQGFQVEEEYIDFAAALGVIGKAASWYKLWNGEQLNGKPNLIAYFKENQAFFEEVKKRTLAAMNPVVEIKPAAAEPPKKVPVTPESGVKKGEMTISLEATQPKPAAQPAQATPQPASQPAAPAKA